MQFRDLAIEMAGEFGEKMPEYRFVSLENGPRSVENVQVAVSVPELIDLLELAMHRAVETRMGVV